MGMGDNLYYVIECKNESNSTEISKEIADNYIIQSLGSIKNMVQNSNVYLLLYIGITNLKNQASPEEDFRILDKR